MHLCSLSSLQITHISSCSRRFVCATSCSIFPLIQVVSDYDLFMKHWLFFFKLSKATKNASIAFWNSRYDVHNELILLEKFHFECDATMLFFVSWSLCKCSCVQHSSCPLAADYFSWLEVFLFIRWDVDFFMSRLIGYLD